MKQKLIISASTLSASLLFSTASGFLSSRTFRKDEGKKAPVIAELFTSQGCSSCPPADCLLSEIIDDESREVIALSFHVDYWNYLGWEDPYSKSSFSERQHLYARAFPSTVYTPPLVIIGQRHVVGSNKYKVYEAIGEVGEKEAANSISLTFEWLKEKNAYRIDYAIQGKLENRLIHMAWVERDIQTRVQRGENKGRTLSHDNVARNFKSLEVNSRKGSVMLNIPSEVRLGRSRIIAYIQDKGSLEIYRGSQLKL